MSRTFSVIFLPRPFVRRIIEILLLLIRFHQPIVGSSTSEPEKRCPEGKGWGKVELRPCGLVGEGSGATSEVGAPSGRITALRQVLTPRGKDPIPVFARMRGHRSGGIYHGVRTQEKKRLFLESIGEGKMKAINEMLSSCGQKSGPFFLETSVGLAEIGQGLGKSGAMGQGVGNPMGEAKRGRSKEVKQPGEETGSCSTSSWGATWLPQSPTDR